MKRAPSSPPTTAVDRYAVRVVDRACDILELLRDAGEPLSLREISARLGLVRSSGFRLLRTLERRGYVERPDGNSRYQLGAGWLGFGRDYAGGASLTEAALPHMRALLTGFGETVNLGVLRDGQVLYLEMLESPQAFRMAARVGTRSPVHATGLGKAIAAFLPAGETDEIIRDRGLAPLTLRTITSRVAWKRELARVRALGYAEDNGETEPEASCIGAPILGPEGRVVAAISLSGPTSRIQAIRPGARRALVAACLEISQRLGYRRVSRGGGERWATAPGRARSRTGHHAVIGRRATTKPTGRAVTKS